MIKKRFRIFASITAVVLMILCLHACSFAKCNSGYVNTREYGAPFSASKDMVCWTGEKPNTFFIEKNGVIKSSDDYGWPKNVCVSNPIFDGNYIYFLAKTNNSAPGYIARINQAEEYSMAEPLTATDKDIVSYLIHDGNIYYISRGKDDTKNKMHVLNLSTKVDEVILSNLDYSSTEFSTNGKKIIIVNKIFDITTRESQIITEDKHIIELGVFKNYYYYYIQTDKGYDLKSVDLKDVSVQTLCDFPSHIGWPGMYGDKIAFISLVDENGSAFKYWYYDISKDEIVTVADSDDPNARFICGYDMTDLYPYMIHDNQFYVYYYEALTRFNMETKEEQVFQVDTKETYDGGHVLEGKWISFKDYNENLKTDNS